MKTPPLPPDVTPAAIARAVVLLRSEGKDAEADYLASHLPPSHDPLPHWNPLQAQQPLSPNDSGGNPFPNAGSLPVSGVPHPDNAQSSGSLPPKIDKAYSTDQPRNEIGQWSTPKHTDNPLTPSFPLTNPHVRLHTPEPAHKFGCVYLTIPEPLRGRVLALGRQIPDSDLAPDGREDNIHATVLYGLHEDVAEADVFEVLSDFRPVKLRLTDVSCFQNEEHDVIKVAVESDAIRRMNNALRRLPYTSKWSTYKPHVTIAYVKPGLGPQYVERFGCIDATCKCLTAVYSTVGGDKHVYPLGRTVTVEKAAMSYLATGTGGALVGPPGRVRGKRKLKRNKLAAACCKALEDIGVDYTTAFADPEGFVFGTKAFDASQHPRESSPHDTKRPGEFAPKGEGQTPKKPNAPR